MRPRSPIGRRVARLAVFVIAAALLNGEHYTWPELASDPGSLVFLGAMYVGFALTVDGLSTRFAWSPRVLMLFGAFVGVVLEGYFHRTFYADEPRILGVNWITVTIMSVYWGVLATALARYVADRLTPRGDDHTLGRRSIVGLAAWWTALLFVWGANLEPLKEPGAIPIALLAAALLAWLLAVGRRREGARSGPWPASRFLDVAIVAYVLVELIVGFTVPGMLERIGIWIVTGLVLGIIGVVVLGRRAAGGVRSAANEIW